MIYFSSDLHFMHNKDFIYEPRGFKSIYEMNETIIKNFHKVVTPEDDLYLLGDIYLGGAVDEEGLKLFHQLPGKLHLIWGNHDTEKRKKDMLIDCVWDTEIIGYAGMLQYKKYHFYLSHFPTITTNFDTDKPLRQRTLCLAGHTHSKEKFEPCGSYNVAVDAHDCYPVSIEEIILDFKNHFSGQK